MRDEAARRIGHLYPKVRLPDGTVATVIAWLWARTVRSPNPAAKGAMVPLVSSFMLSTKEGRQAWVEPVLDAAAPEGYRFEVRTGTKPPAAAKNGTKASRGANFVCVLTNTPISPEHIRTEGKAGRMGARLMAIVAEGRRERIFLSPNNQHEQCAASAQPTWAPEQPMARNSRYMTPTIFGFDTFGDLFTPRQLTVLATFCQLIPQVRENARRDAETAGWMTNSDAYADTIALYSALILGRLCDLNNAFCTWMNQPTKLHVAHIFSLQAIPMVWDFAEANPFGPSAGGFEKTFRFVPKVLDKLPFLACSINVRQQDFLSASVNSNYIWSTDPPYSDNVPYSEIADFFYLWFRQALFGVETLPIATIASPRTNELVVEPDRHNNVDDAEAFYRQGMTQTLHRMGKNNAFDFPITVYYAYKQDELEAEGILSTGWAVFLEAVLRSGFQVDGTWPMRTERSTRMRSIGSNALASSIVLVCRRRPTEAPAITRAELLRRLRAELPEALKKLQESAIAPVDMAQAAIGPGMAVFSRRRAVLESDDRPMTVKTALALINQELDAFLAREDADYDPWTRFAIGWLEDRGHETGEYGRAEVLATAKAVAVQGVVEAGILEARGGKVRLLRREELADGWDPASDARATVWEATQHLIRRMETKGEAAAADLLARLGPRAEAAKELAYRLYQVCERRGWAQEAIAYNGLVLAWPELTRLAQSVDTSAAQREMAV